MKLRENIAFWFIGISFIGCQSMKEISLYGSSDSQSGYDSFEPKIIFTDSQQDGVWGMKNTPCKTIHYDTIHSFYGKDHLHIQWKQTSDCKYLGMGFKWGNYKGKNLLPIMKDCAIEMMIRVDEGKFTKIPMFFGLTDYSGKQCMSKINILDIEGGFIDTTWRKVLIPLPSFNHEKKEVNLANIKELRLEFQREGDIHIDRIRIVPHDHNFKKTNTRYTKIFKEHPIQIGQGREYWWGVNSLYSSSFSFNDESIHERIYANISEKDWKEFGFGVYKWHRADISEIASSSAISFILDAKEMPKIQTTLVAYTGPKRRIQKTLNTSNYIQINDSSYQICIPLKSFAEFENFHWNTLKEIRFKIIEGSQFEMGDFKIIEFRGNPKKPNQWIRL